MKLSHPLRSMHIMQEGSEDLDCSDLCLPTLKEEVDSIVAQKLEAEKELSTDKGSGKSGFNQIWLRHQEMLAQVFIYCTYYI